MFIPVTQAGNNKTYINTSHIAYIHRNYHGETIIQFIDGISLTVAEPPDTILSMIPLPLGVIK